MAYENNVDPAIHATLIKDFFNHNNMPIAYCEKIEGQRINEKGQYLIGPWAGPVADVTNTFHEMSHFAEREIEKLKEFPYLAWGFSFGKYWECLGRSGFEAQTDQDVRREQRVWAFQMSIQRHYKIDESSYDTISSAKWLGGWCYYQPFPGEKLYCSQDHRKLDKLAEETDLMSRNEYTYEAFCDAWKQRIEALKNLVRPKAA